MCWNISRVLDALSLGPTLGPPSRRFETSPGTQGEVAARAELTARWPSCAPIHGVAFKSNTSIQPTTPRKKLLILPICLRVDSKIPLEQAKIPSLRDSNSFHVQSTLLRISDQ